MSETRICLIGCDDETEFTLELTEAERALLVRVARLSQATSKYGCMPVMRLHDTAGREIEPLTMEDVT